MQYLTISKALKCHHQDVQITIVSRVDAKRVMHGQESVAFQDEADALCKALTGVLPQATLDRFLAGLLRHRACDLYVACLPERKAYREPPTLLHGVSWALAIGLVYPLPFVLWGVYCTWRAKRRAQIVKEELNNAD